MVKLFLIGTILCEPRAALWLRSSRWAEDVNLDASWPEYPRPQMVRGNWTNLNGLWQYAVTRGEMPTEFGGRILVPFPIESALSGVKQPIDSRSYLWYRHTFAAPARESGERTLPRFGARAGISINGRPFPEYPEFDTESFEFTPVKQFLHQGHNEISVNVTRFDDGRFDGTRAAFDIRRFAIDREPVPRP